MKICKKDPMTSYIMHINKVSRLMVQVTEVIEKCHREVKIKIKKKMCTGPFSHQLLTDCNINDSYYDYKCYTCN
jgi:hypothetical protein